MVALWSPNVSDQPQLFSCLLSRGRGPEAHCALWALVEPRILWLSPHSPWGGGAPKEGLQGAHRPAPILSTSLSLNAIFQDLFEVFTKTSLKRIRFLLKHSSKYSPKNIGEYFEKFEGVLFS